MAEASKQHCERKDYEGWHVCLLALIVSWSEENGLTHHPHDKDFQKLNLSE